MATEKEAAPSEKARRMRRSAKAHWLLAELTKHQSQLHRELATLLDKEAEAHVVLDRWAREGAERQRQEKDSDTLRKWGREHVKQNALAKREALAHRDLAARSDARTLWHKTIAVALMRESAYDGKAAPSAGPEPDGDEAAEAPAGSER